MGVRNILKWLRHRELSSVESCFRTGLIDREKADRIRALAETTPSLVSRVKDYLMHPESSEFPLYVKGPEGEDYWINLACALGLAELASSYKIRRDIVVGASICFIVRGKLFDKTASRAQAKAFVDFARKHPETADVINGLCENKGNLPGYDVCGLKPLHYIALELGDKELVQHIESRM